MQRIDEDDINRTLKHRGVPTLKYENGKYKMGNVVVCSRLYFSDLMESCTRQGIDYNWELAGMLISLYYRQLRSNLRDCRYS